jgi:hypothetical protein
MAEFQGGQNAGAYLGVQAQRPPEVVLSQVAPTTNQRRFRIGTLWVDRSSNQSYQLTNVVAGSATWTLLGPGASDVDTLTGDGGGAISPAAGNITLAGGTNITTAGAGNTITFNLDNAITVATSVTSASFFTSDAAAGLTISGNDIDADGTDANIAIVVTPKGTGDFVVDNGDIQATSGDIIATRSSAAGEVTVEVTNSDNTSTDSDSFFEVAVGGTSSGNPGIRFQISGGQNYSMGIDNASANDDLLICGDNDIGTDPLVTIAEAGNVTVNKGNLILGAVATQIQMNGGAATDFIGEATLTAGTVTIANTNIAANDRILLSRRDINGSTALGSLTYSISAATSFTITAVQAGTPAATETNDVSIVSYVIIREN